MFKHLSFLSSLFALCASKWSLTDTSEKNIIAHTKRVISDICAKSICRQWVNVSECAVCVCTCISGEK